MHPVCQGFDWEYLPPASLNFHYLWSNLRQRSWLLSQSDRWHLAVFAPLPAQVHLPRLPVHPLLAALHLLCRRDHHGEHRAPASLGKRPWSCDLTCWIVIVWRLFLLSFPVPLSTNTSSFRRRVIRTEEVAPQPCVQWPEADPNLLILTTWLAAWCCQLDLAVFVMWGSEAESVFLSGVTWISSGASIVVHISWCETFGSIVPNRHRGSALIRTTRRRHLYSALSTFNI